MLYGMMQTTGSPFAFTFLWAAHTFSVILFFTGVLFLIVLAIKTFSHARLLHWGIGLLLVGTLLCLATIAVRGAPWTAGSMMRESGSLMRGGFPAGTRGGWMDGQGMMRGGMMDLSMGQMMDSLEGKTGDDFDEAFLRAMIPHHRVAVDMAAAARDAAGHIELKALAEDIITAQEREIDLMQQWLRDWKYDE